MESHKRQQERLLAHIVQLPVTKNRASDCPDIPDMLSIQLRERIFISQPRRSNQFGLIHAYPHCNRVTIEQSKWRSEAVPTKSKVEKRRVPHVSRLRRGS